MSEKSSTLSSLPGYGLLAVALAFLFGVTPARKPEEHKPEPGAASPVLNVAVAEKKVTESGHLNFLREKKLLEPDRKEPTPVANTRFLILTLPDPIDSQLGYWYDQSIDALTRAMSDLNKPGSPRYSLVDRWFPWTVVGEDKSKNLTLRAGTPRSEPGVMIYQRNGQPGEHMVVLVVGENPLSGIAVEALKTALTLAGNAREYANKPIPVVGPFCTGSQISLGRTVADWADAKRPHASSPVVTCVTGSALGLKPWAELCEGPEGVRLQNLCGDIPPRP